jgi:mycoredoxin
VTTEIDPESDSGQTAVPDSDARVVHFFWRPGCPFCGSLRHRLKRLGVTVNEINIWEDPVAAGFVRSVAKGNETVPTIAVGDSALVNPSPRAVLALLADAAPHLLPPDGERHASFSPLARLRHRHSPGAP